MMAGTRQRRAVSPTEPSLHGSVPLRPRPLLPISSPSRVAVAVTATASSACRAGGTNGTRPFCFFFPFLGTQQEPNRGADSGVSDRDASDGGTPLGACVRSCICVIPVLSCGRLAASASRSGSEEAGVEARGGRGKRSRRRRASGVGGRSARQVLALWGEDGARAKGAGGAGGERRRRPGGTWSWLRAGVIGCDRVCFCG